jgi:hypothetical protein
VDATGNESSPSVQVSATTGSVAASQTEILPLADAFVRDGTSYQGVNYGSANPLVVKDAGYGFNRETFLKFDVSGASDALSAKIQIRIASDSDAPATLRLYRVNSDDWTESGVTFSNRPALATSLGTATVPPGGGVLEFTILSTVLAESGGDGVLSLALVGAGNEDKFIKIYSREAADPALSPRIVLTLPEAPAPETYEGWAAEQDWGGVPVAQREAESDPDGDGNSNALERFFGTDPIHGQHQLFPTQQSVEEADGMLTVRFGFPRAVLSAEYTMEGADPSLTVWTAIQDAVVEEDEEAGMTYISFTFDPAAQPCRFFRLRVRDKEP